MRFLRGDLPWRTSGRRKQIPRHPACGRMDAQLRPRYWGIRMGMAEADGRRRGDVGEVGEVGT